MLHLSEMLEQLVSRGITCETCTAREFSGCSHLCEESRSLVVFIVVSIIHVHIEVLVIIVHPKYIIIFGM